MTLIWIVIGVLAAAAALALLRKPSPPLPARAVARPEPIAPAATPSRPETAAAPVAIAPVAPMPLPAPAALETFQLLRAADLPEERRMAYLSTFHEIPRPPKLLDHLLSSGFVNTASSAQLVDLITAEPLIAARILFDRQLAPLRPALAGRQPRPSRHLPRPQHGPQPLPAVHPGRLLQAGQHRAQGGARHRLDGQRAGQRAGLGARAAAGPGRPRRPGQRRCALVPRSTGDDRQHPGSAARRDRRPRTAAPHDRRAERCSASARPRSAGC